MEKSAKRWIRRLLSGDIGKPIPPGYKSHLLGIAIEGLRNNAYNPVPIFKGTAKERLAKFKASGETPHVQHTFAGYNEGRQRDGLRWDVAEYVNAARNSPYGKALYDRLLKKRRRTEDVMAARFSSAVGDQLGLKSMIPYDALRILKQYYTPNVYGITGHLASPSASAKANEYAIQAYKNGLTEISSPEDLQKGWKSINTDRLLVGGPGIKHTPDDIQFMRNSGSSNEAREAAENMLYEASVGKGTFTPKRVFVKDTPDNRSFFGVDDSVKGIDTADLVPEMRDTVFKGSGLAKPPTTETYLAHRAGLFDTVASNPKYKHIEKSLARFLPDNPPATLVKKPNNFVDMRWYSPNPIVSGDYMGARTVIPVDASKLRQLGNKLGLRTALDYDSLLERIAPSVARNAQRLDRIDKDIANIPEWVKHDVRGLRF